MEVWNTGVMEARGVAMSAARGGSAGGGSVGLPCIARHVIVTLWEPRFVTYMASYNVVRGIYRACCLPCHRHASRTSFHESDAHLRRGEQYLSGSTGRRGFWEAATRMRCRMR